MSRTTRASALVVMTFVAIVMALATDRWFVLLAMATPPLFGLLRQRSGRRCAWRSFVRLGPLLVVSVVAGWLWHGPLTGILNVPLRMLSAATWSTWLTHVLSAAEIEVALATLGVPHMLISLVGQTHRVGRQLGQTLAETWNAATLRGGMASWWVTLATAGRVAGVVLVRACDRSEQMADAYELRGLGRVHTDAPEAK